MIAFGGLIAVATLVGCDSPDSVKPGKPQPGAPPADVPSASDAKGWFSDATQQAGLRFNHDAGPIGKYWMPQAIGSGAALFDCDNDGRLDILLLQNSGRQPTAGNRLFRQKADGQFVDVSAGSGLDTKGQAMGVAVGDVNNDGLLDVLVTEFGGLKFFLNRGGGKFVETSREAGLDSPLWGASASFCDFDRDGWLDLVVVNYVAYDPARPCNSAAGVPDFCAPKEFEGTVTKLYRNVSQRAAPAINSALRPARFQDVTLSSGLGRLPGPGLGVLCADFNADRWPDIFVANDGQPNRLWINQHDGSFRDEAVTRGVAYNAQGSAEANMGVAWADVDGRGGFDLFVTHLTEERHTLWRQEAPGLFADRTVSSLLAQPGSRGTGFGAVLADFDVDGDADLAIANGRVSRGPERDMKRLGEFWCHYAEQNLLFENDGQGRFNNVSADNAPFCSQAGVYRSLSCGDVDNDGDLDLLVTQVAGPAQLLRNVAARRGHWLMVRAVEGDPIRDAYCAEVRVRAGQRRWSRLVNPGYSYLCSNDPRAHFGLGSAKSVDELRVVWPDGSEEQFAVDGVDRLLVARKGKGSAVAASAPPKQFEPATYSGARNTNSAVAPAVATAPASLPAIDLAQVDLPVRRAIEEAQSAIEADRSSADAWGQLGMLLYAHGLAPEAVDRCFAEAARLAPKSPRWPYVSGMALSTRDAAAAIERLGRAAALTTEPNDAPRLRLAEMLLAEDRIDEAAGQFEQALASFPGNARAELGLGRAAARRGEFAKAVDHLELASADPRTRKAALVALAEARSRLGNQPQADLAAQQAAASPGDAPWPDRYLAEVMQLRRGRREALARADGLLARNLPGKAAKMLDATLTEQPELGWAWLLMGRARLDLHDPQGAELALWRAIEIMPESIESHFYLGAALLQQRQLPAASDAFAAAARQAPDFAMAHLYHGICLRQLRQPQAALEALRSALRAKPDLTEAHVELAALLTSMGEQNAAQEHLHTALQLEPDNARAKAIQATIKGQPNGRN